MHSPSRICMDGSSFLPACLGAFHLQSTLNWTLPARQQQVTVRHSKNHKSALWRGRSLGWVQEEARRQVRMPRHCTRQAKTRSQLSIKYKTKSNTREQIQRHTLFLNRKTTVWKPHKEGNVNMQEASGQFWESQIMRSGYLYHLVKHRTTIFKTGTGT